METGELFRIKEGSKEQKEMIFKVEESNNGRCQNCEGDNDKLLCKRLPHCYDIVNNQPSYKFVKLTSNEAKRAIKQKLTINQY
jgi:hypothetical protein